MSKSDLLQRVSNFLERGDIYDESALDYSQIRKTLAHIKNLFGKMDAIMGKAQTVEDLNDIEMAAMWEMYHSGEHLIELFFDFQCDIEMLHCKKVKEEFQKSGKIGLNKSIY